MKRIIISTLLFFLSSFLVAAAETIEVKTTIKIEKKEEDLFKNQNLNFKINPQRFDIEVDKKYIGNIGIQNTSNSSINVLVDIRGIDSSQIKDMSKETYIYPKYLKVPRKSTRYVKFEYNPKEPYFNRGRAYIFFKEIPNNLESSSYKNQEIGISINGR